MEASAHYVVLRGYMIWDPLSRQGCASIRVDAGLDAFALPGTKSKGEACLAPTSHTWRATPQGVWQLGKKVLATIFADCPLVTGAPGLK